MKKNNEEEVEKRLKLALRIFQNDPKTSLREAQRLLTKNGGKGMRHESLALLRAGVMAAQSVTPELRSAAQRSLRMGLSATPSVKAIAESPLEVPMLSELDKPTLAALTEEYVDFKPSTRKFALGALAATVVCMVLAIAGAVGLNCAIFGVTGFGKGSALPDAGVDVGEGEGE